MFETVSQPQNFKKARASVELGDNKSAKQDGFKGDPAQRDILTIDDSSETDIQSEESKEAAPLHHYTITQNKTCGEGRPRPEQQHEDVAKWGMKEPIVKDAKVGAAEVFCGCARMARELQNIGFDAVAIDYKGNKDKPETKSYVELDLSRPWGVAELRKIIKDRNVKVVFMAPPCGSASAARNIRRKYGPDPKPLRSLKFPDGLPNLGQIDKERVATANKLYAMAADLAWFCEENGISWSIENPTHSLMWSTTPFRQLYGKLRAAGTSPNWADMQMCMHGGDRDKRTSLLFGGPVSLAELAVMCDKSHTHKAWGLTKTPGTLWATAQERNYPRTFCKRVAKIFARKLLPKTTNKPRAAAPQAEEKKWAGRQERKSPNNLITEFKEIVEFNAATRQQTKAVESEATNFPMWCGDKQVGNIAKVLECDPEDGGDGSRYKGSIGIYWTKNEFIEVAKQRRHPLDEDIRVPQRLAQVIFDWASLGPTLVKEKRKQNLEYYKYRARMLEKEEEVLHSQLKQEVRDVIKGKNVLIFKEMLKDIDYDDMSVVELITLGVRVVGTCQNTGIWTDSEDKLPKTTVRHLWASAKDSQEDVQNFQPQKIDELAMEVWKLTAGPGGEVETGLLKGPMSKEEISKQVGSLWIPARRFGIQQGAKIRPVDDFSQYGINRAFGSEQKVSLLGIDHVVSWSRAILQAEKDGKVEVTDNTGAKWETQLNPEWRKGKWASLTGRVADLKNAYKQVAVAPEHKSFNVIAVYDPIGKQTRLFRALSLMFGQTAAVYAFLRISRAIAALGTRLFSLFLVEYFDDFTQVESSQLGDSAQETFEEMLSIIGWQVADTQSKRKPMSTLFLALGIQVDFDKSDEGYIILRPKDGRIDGINEMVNDILKKGTLSFKEALSIKGRLQFAEGQLFYRVVATVCRLLSRWASKGGWRPITDEMRAALKSIEPALGVAGPRIIEPQSLLMPVIIFTDGACEPEGTSIGGVLLVQGQRPRAFGAMLRRDAAERLTSKIGQTQVIGQAELLPMLVAKTIWRKSISNRKVIFFVDNESARLAMIKGYSPVLASLRIIMACAQSDAQDRSSPWYARVPTKSNVADEPSRMKKCHLVGMGAIIDKPYLGDNYRWFSEVLE